MSSARALAWRYPELWTLAVSAAAWPALIWHHAHQSHGPIPSGWSDAAVSSLLMPLAMMVPLMLGGSHAVAARSLWRRRHQAIAEFLAGYLALWFVADLLIVLLSESLDRVGWSAPSAAVGLLLAVGWQYAPPRRRALLACLRAPNLSPHGRRADRDCARYGWQTGLHCLAACWAIMTVAALARHHVVVMLLASAVLWTERYSQGAITTWWRSVWEQVGQRGRDRLEGAA